MCGSINHGLINFLYYKGTYKKETVRIHGNAYIQLIEDYFIHYYGRDKYYVAMKHHAAKILRQAGFGFQEIANMMGLKNHTSIDHLLKHYNPLPDHEEFIKEHFLQLLYNQEYPITTKGWQEKKISEYKIVKREDLWQITKEKEQKFSQEKNSTTNTD